MNNIKKKIKEILEKISNTFYTCRVKQIELKKIKDKRRTNLYQNVSFDDIQINEIQNFYKNNYGKNIDLRWHKLYQSYTGNYDYKYFPEILFSTKLEPKLCNRTIAKQLADKSMVEILYSNVNDLYFPETTVLCASGIFYDKNKNIISKEKAKKIISNCGKKIIKKINDSCSGRGVLLINMQNGFDRKNNKNLDELLLEFSDNFIIQEQITNREDIRKIYNKSLNTFRVITYVCNGKIYHAPIVMRIGCAGNEVDNIHAGGLFIGLNDNGELLENAYTEFQTIYKSHPDSNVIFKGYNIKGIDRIINIAYKCHGLTPHMGIISWDFSIDNKDRIVLIEVNLTGQSVWFPQMAHGKGIFGENTKFMLNLIKNGSK